jgi:hypothetical protein
MLLVPAERVSAGTAFPTMLSATTELAIPSATPSRVETAWVIGRRCDLAFLIGGSLVAYGLLAAHLLFGVAAVVIYCVWILAIDGPHVFATLSRTYLEPSERAARAGLLRWSLGLFALGPASVGLSALTGTRLPYDLFLVGCSLWAYWHVVRQHYGVMVLYKKKAGDMAPADDHVDATCLYVGLLAPFVGFVLSNPRALAMAGLSVPPPWALPAAWGAFGAAVLALGLRQLLRLVQGRAFNGSKVLFVLTALSVSAVVMSPAVASRIQYEAVFPIVTSFHNVQYLAIVWFFHEHRRRDGLYVPAVARSIWVLLGAGVVFTIGYRVLLGCAFSAWPGCDVGAETIALPAGLTLSDLGVGFLWGFALHHYYLDQKIWHVRRDRAVSRDLGLDPVQDWKNSRPRKRGTRP